MLIQRTPLNVQIKKFIKRFQYLESKAGDLGKPLMDMTLAEMDIFWEEAKKL
jgi:XTP/dITP diphosphohydrolase